MLYKNCSLDKLKLIKQEKKFLPNNTFFSKEIFLNNKKNTLSQICNIQELLINLRKFIISLISNGFEFKLQKNYTFDEVFKLENKSIFNFLKIKPNFKNNNFYYLINLINSENKILLENIPFALEKYFKLKQNFKIYEEKICKLNQKQEEKNFLENIN